MAEQINMPFWVWIWVGQKNCVLGGVPDLSMKIGNLWGGDIPSHCKVRETCVVFRAETTELIEMQFIVMGPRNHVLFCSVL